MLAGLSPIGNGDLKGNRIGYSMFRKYRMWKHFTDGNGDVIFSFDAGGRDGKHQPHSDNPEIAAEAPGINITRTDGSSAWIDKDATYPHSWHISTPTRPFPSNFRIPNKLQESGSGDLVIRVDYGVGGDSYFPPADYGMVAGGFVTE